MNAENLTMNPNEMSSEDLEAVSGGCIVHAVYRYLEGANDKIAGRKAKHKFCLSYWIGYHQRWW